MSGIRLLLRSVPFFQLLKVILYVFSCRVVPAVSRDGDDILPDSLRYSRWPCLWPHLRP